MTSDCAATPPRWRRRPAERRREILDAALGVFGSHGYDCATVAEVARRAGVCPATVLHYFGSKASLFETLLEDRFLGGLDEEEALVTEVRDEPVRFTMRRLMTRMWKRLMAPGMADLLLVGMAKSTTFPEAGHVVFRSISERWRRLLVTVLQTAIDRGEYRAVDPHLTARVLAGGLGGMMMGMHRFACYDPSAPPPDALLSHYLDLVDHALSPSPEVAISTPALDAPSKGER